MTTRIPSPRARAGIGLAALALTFGLVAACASNGVQTAAPSENTSRIRKTATGEEIIQADPVALGRAVQDLAPKKTTTTTAGNGTGGPGETLPGGETTTTTAAQTTTTPPITQPPIQTTQTTPPVTFTFRTTQTTAKRNPQPYAGSLSAEEGMLLAKLQQVTGRTLALGAGLMSAAQAGQGNPPGEAGITYLSYKSANIWGLGQSAEGVLANAKDNLLPLDGKPYNYVGVGFKTDGSRVDFFYIIAVV